MMVSLPASRVVTRSLLGSAGTRRKGVRAAGEGAWPSYIAPNVDPSDDALLVALQAGDDGALGALLERHLPAVYRFGLKMCRDPEDAKDVVAGDVARGGPRPSRVPRRLVGLDVAFRHRS